MRSSTAETMYNSDSLYFARSAGIASTAKVKLTTEIILWADKIFAMEEKQLAFIKKKFPVEVENKIMISLDIPDCYYFMEPELIEEIKTKVNPYLT